MKISRLVLLALLTGALTVLGCGGSGNGGDGGNGNGGSAGDGGSGGSAGTAGGGGSAGSGGNGSGGSGGVAISPGLYSSQPRGTLVCLFVNQDGTKLVADSSCPFGPGDSQMVAFRLTSSDPVEGSCAVNYPVEGDEPQEIPIVDGRFEIDTTQTDGIGAYTIKVSGEFNENGTVSGVGTHSRDCPTDRNWSAGPGCCSQCEWCK
jgi:hypothetical protein